MDTRLRIGVRRECIRGDSIATTAAALPDTIAGPTQPRANRPGYVNISARSAEALYSRSASSMKPKRRNIKSSRHARLVFQPRGSVSSAGVSVAHGVQPKTHQEPDDYPR